MLLDLPDPLAARLSDLAQRRGYSTPVEFLADIVEDDFVAALESRREDIDDLLAEGLTNGHDIPESPEFWKRLQDRALGVA